MLTLDRPDISRFHPARRPLPPRTKVSYPKAMTIVAGFLVQDGLLLGADTMYTGGAKIHQPKLFGYMFHPDTPQSASIAFALAGHEDFGKMAIDDCVEAIEAYPLAELSIKNVRGLLRNAVKTINDEYVGKKPSAERESARFELIIGMWLPLAGGLRLFRTNGSAVNDAGNYHCTGFGAYLGDYLMRNIFSPTIMRIKDAALLAIQALSAAKAYDASCGGDTQFMTIFPGGKISAVVPYDVRTSEYYISEFEKLSRSLLFNIGNAAMADKDFETWLSSFADEVRRIRSFWKGEGFGYLAKQFAKFTPTEQPNPQSPTADPSRPPPSPESPEGSDES